MKKVVTGRAKGGVARAEALSPERRSEIARKAALARRPLKATHKGSFKEEFGIDVECYVLNDETKTAVISQRGMGAALGLAASGSALPRFMAGATIAKQVGAELREKLSNPLIFQWSAPGAGPASTVHGYDVTILIDICKAVLTANADGHLAARYANVVKQAHVITQASAKAGIKGLVYALAGYDATREEIISEFRRYVQQEARSYEKEFPEQLYTEWHRIYKLPRPRVGKPWKLRHLTVAQVYVPLAHSNGKILDLVRMQKEAADDRGAKLHQFLSEVGAKALRTHLGQLLGIAQVSDNKEQYERNFRRVFGDGQRDLFELLEDAADDEVAE